MSKRASLREDVGPDGEGSGRGSRRPPSDRPVFADEHEALRYLLARVDVERTHPGHVNPNVFKLDRTWALMAALGNPQNAFRSIHVAGSKGKGSVCEMTAAALTGCGYTVGLFTSPHLVTIRERIRIQGRMIDGQQFAEVVGRAAAAGREIASTHGEATFFELMTAAGFLHFAEQAIDLAVVEVGLGGRLDCTNVVLPEVSVITAIQLEHTQILGDTLAKIAAEKAGIIKPRTPIVTFAQQAPEVLEVFRAVAAERQAPLWIVGEDFDLTWRTEAARESGRDLSRESGRDDARDGARDGSREGSREGGSVVRISLTAARPGPTGASRNAEANAAARSAAEGSAEGAAVGAVRISGGFEHVAVPLRGEHQALNCGLALAALEILRSRGLRIENRDALAGLARTPNAGRLEFVHRGPSIVIDGAHNPESVDRLMKSLAGLGGHEAVIVVFGCAGDKNIPGMLAKLATGADKVIFTKAAHTNRGADPEELRRRYTEITGKPALAAPSVAEALNLALRAASGDSLICASGSFYIAGEVKRILQTSATVPDGKPD